MAAVQSAPRSQSIRQGQKRRVLSRPTGNNHVNRMILEISDVLIRPMATNAFIALLVSITSVAEIARS